MLYIVAYKIYKYSTGRTISLDFNISIYATDKFAKYNLCK